MPEANARIKINKLLEKSGWRLVDSDEGKASVTVEDHLIVSPNKETDTLGEDFEKAKGGFIDYLLWGQNKKPLCVLEAKRSSIHPLDAKEQARTYANSIGVKYVILSNGELHYFWDIEVGNPEKIYHFPNQESLEKNVSATKDTNALVNEVVGDDYIALTQMPDYQLDPRWKTEEGKKELMENEGLRFLRYYQKEAIESLQQAIAKGKKRFLFEMATGTGKTLTSAALIKLFIKTKNASRVLFLVDRLELENQAEKNFREYLSPDITTVVYKQNKNSWSRAEVVVTTIQSIMHDNKFEDLFSPTDFDLIISDEAHRAISGEGLSRNVFDYFTGYKLGLTATPKDYLKNLTDKDLSEKDQRELERRTLFSTYETFGCNSGDPTFRYDLLRGVNDGFLINPYVLDCRTKITAQLLSDDGYAAASEKQTEEAEEEVYFAKDFEKNFFSPKTNQQFAETFFANAQRDSVSGEIGKTLIFCVSQSHARKMAQILNQMAHELYPGKYNSDFALQITSSVKDAQPFTIRFANNNLNGRTAFLPGYKSSKTRVCITVGMMTTGYDCSDILNICLMRPIFSPQDFVQIKGRGTRKHLFSYKKKLNGTEVAEQKPKEEFYLFDYFANCEYFEDKFPYDEVIDLPKQREKLIPTGSDPGVSYPLPDGQKGFTRYGLDPLQGIKGLKLSDGGMRIDRELYQAVQRKKQDHEEQIKKSDKLWSKFSSINLIPKEIIDQVEDIFYLCTLNESILSDFSAKEFSNYSSDAELFNSLNTIGAKWIENITHFLNKE
ncbi:MAG: DEAD/DEAH box helicase family protein [Candidatus Pacebacteria bacterium]|nr:DEAD/DEAH box helicase family protein [Candidatus Paceibacterota bacterium]